MANPNQMIKGKRRGRWVRDGARAIIASSTASGRFLILRGGFVRFQNTAMPFFKELAGFDFDSNELRWIFEYLARYVLTHERRLQPGFEQLYQLQLHKDVVREEKVDAPTGDDMRIEFIKDGALKDVLAADLNPRGGFRR